MGTGIFGRNLKASAKGIHVSGPGVGQQGKMASLELETTWRGMLPQICTFLLATATNIAWLVRAGFAAMRSALTALGSTRQRAHGDTNYGAAVSGRRCKLLE